ncbi:MAG: hypothetical protein BroJett003_22510 [Planctomycetota bacterium]|nr:MAG: hypothetical protein BroJett003_22510 [Planctomycetota bacterium]
MRVRFDCPKEGCVALIELEPLQSAVGGIECPRCRTRHRVTLSEDILRNNRVDACALCGCRELFIRKDFPQRLGLGIVVVAAVISFLSYKSNLLLSWGVLAAAVVIDLAIYFVIGTVTVCYACRAEYRDTAANESHRGFDLAQSEKY